MKKFIKNIVYCCLCAVVIALIPLFFSKAKPIDLDIPVLDLNEIQDEKKQEEKAAKRAAARVTAKRMSDCMVDDDCVIVAKDPCGCLLGPQGVTAINVSYAVAFSEQQAKAPMTTCPSAIPSTEAECSENAHSVCRANKCTIVY